MNTLTKKEGCTATFFFLFALLLSYFPTLSECYLHTDDYFWSGWGAQPETSIVRFMTLVGRPLGSLPYFLFSHVKSMELFRLIRFAGLLHLSLLGLLFYQWMRHFYSSTLFCLCSGILVLTLPAFQVYQSYLSTFPHALALTFSMAASLTLWRALLEKRSLLYFVSFGLLLAAFAFHQGNALFGIVLLVPILLGEKSASKRRFLASYLLLLVGTLLLYYLLWSSSWNFFNFEHISKYDPERFVKDWPAKLSWFWHGPLREVASLWFTTRIAWVTSVTVYLFLIITIAPHFSKKPMISRLHFHLKIISKHLQLLFLLPLGFGIHLFSASSTLEYRSYGVLGSLLLVMLLCLIKEEVTDKNQSSKAPGILLLFLAIFSGVAVQTAHTNVYEYFVRPNMLERRAVTAAIHGKLDLGKNPHRVHVYVTQHSFSRFGQNHDLGEPTFRHGPNIRPAIWATMEGLGLDGYPVVSTSNDKNDPQWVDFGIRLDGMTSIEAKLLPPRPQEVILVDVESLFQEKASSLRELSPSLAALE